MPQSQADIQRAYRQRQKAKKAQQYRANSGESVAQLALFSCEHRDMLDDDIPPRPRQLSQAFGDLDVFSTQPQWYITAVENVDLEAWSQLSDDTITALLRNELTPQELIMVFTRVGVHIANTRSAHTTSNTRKVPHTALRKAP